MQLAAMCGCCIHVQLQFGQQFILSAESELNVHRTIQDNGAGSGQIVHSEMLHTATPVTVGFTYRYTVLPKALLSHLFENRHDLGLHFDKRVCKVAVNCY